MGYLFQVVKKKLDVDEVENVNSPIGNKITQYIEAHESNGNFNGNVLIAKSDSIIYSNSFGLANREFGIENSPSTKFLIGSITKPFTAYGILLLEHQGKISLNDKLIKYFPNFPNADKVTIYQLLTHTSGIKDYHTLPDWKDESLMNISQSHTIERIKSDPYIFEPGERFSYSNSGYIMLGLIIEQVCDVVLQLKWN